MKKVLLALLALMALHAMPVLADGEPLPEIAPTEDPPIPPLDAPATE